MFTHAYRDTKTAETPRTWKRSYKLVIIWMERNSNNNNSNNNNNNNNNNNLVLLYERLNGPLMKGLAGRSKAFKLL